VDDGPTLDLAGVIIVHERGKIGVDDDRGSVGIVVRGDGARCHPDEGIGASGIDRLVGGGVLGVVVEDVGHPTGHAIESLGDYRSLVGGKGPFQPEPPAVVVPPPP
jgi:hypothetical protein